MCKMDSYLMCPPGDDLSRDKRYGSKIGQLFPKSMCRFAQSWVDMHCLGITLTASDGVLDGSDVEPLNPFVCEDADGDGGDDCAVVQPPDTANDGTDTDAEVNYLLDFVAGSGCVFQRNDSRHDPESAADHLRLKYDRGGKYVNSAEQFIDRLATESSWTGKDYTVTCDGQTEPSADWLHRALDAHRQAE